MIYAVSAGQYSSNKGDDILRKRHKYLNYGLLGIGSLIKHLYHKDVLVVQGDYDPVLHVVNKMNSKFLIEDTDLILLSIPSYFSLPWCEEFCEVIKNRYGTRIYAGGRWVVNKDIEWISQRLPLIDKFYDGFGEQHLSDILFSSPSKEDDSMNVFGFLDYSLLIDYQDYQPCIEISRGCGMGCSFCLDGKTLRTKNKSVIKVKKEIMRLQALYGNPNIYFESPHFIFEKDWSDELINSLAGNHINWRCTSRVDTIPIQYIEKLFDSGLSIIDVGLESASLSQLLKMRKTRCPEKYLLRANELLKECNRVGVRIKLNILLYPGETRETLKETTDWLMNHSQYINGVSTSSMIYYRNAGSLNDLISQGAAVKDDENLERNGYVFLDVGRDIKHDDTKKIGLAFSQQIVTKEDYYSLKSFSYFSPSYTYSMFQEDIGKMSEKDLPFKVIS